ncbi:MAG: TetR/AcrR family transcriptional regulator [Hydrogenophaga sp.]|nr:TetR/AcrR family transcriptional regulator [Hydrogenophaga sp.]
MKAPSMVTSDTTSEQHEHRSRLLQAMASVSASKGVATATIADIVREAGVSKRTFYEHFDCKETCFLTLYRLTSASALRTLREAVQPDRPWQTQVEHALDAYFSHLAAGPGLVVTLFVEIDHLGPEGLRVRREVMAQFADFVLETVNGEPGSGGVPLSQVLTPTMALAAVGGIHELVMQAIERGEVDRLQELTPSASAVVRLLTRADAT